MALDASMRARREAFVTGHAGTTAAETLAAVLTLPAGVLLHRMLVVGSHAAPLPSRLAAELATVAGPVLLGCTLLAPHLGGLLFACVLAAQVADLARVRRADCARLAGGEADRAAAARRVASEPRKTFVTNFRAGMMLGTVVAILGVDFPAFPRRFAKTEVSGTSLMDLGVGGVVFASALVSRQARALAARRASSGGGGGGAPPPSLWDALRTLRGAASAAAPLVAVGGARTAVHAALNLPLHVSEYGLHWNFFFTVAAVTVACAAGEAALTAAAAVAASAPVPQRLRALLRRAVPAGGGGGVRTSAASAAALAAAICVAYQRWLAEPAPAALLAEAPPAGVLVSAQDAILHGRRPADGSFVAQNREGLAGVPGFTAIYLLGLAGGALLLDPRSAGSERHWRRALAAGGRLVAAAWAAFAVATRAYGPPSRRLANAPYVAWVAAVCGTVLWALAAVELLTVLPSDGSDGDPTGQQRLAALAAASGVVEDGVPDDTASAEAVAAAGAPRRSTRLSQPSRRGGGGRRGSSSKSPARRPSASAAAAAAASAAYATDDASAVHFASSPASVAFLEAINANFFAAFMGANLLTGAVNAAVSTLDTPDGAAVAILAAYVAAVAGGATWLAARGVSLKFW